MKLTAKLAELRTDISDGAIDDHYVAGVGRGTASGLRGGDHQITAFTTAPIPGRPVCAQKTALRPHRSAWIESQGPNGVVLWTGRVVITQFSSGYLYRDLTIQLVRVPDRAIIDALRSGHAPIRNHLIKSIDPTPT
ncbi:hypothetical protein [Mesorhizobium sp. M0767]|uniref:hypothetical protein n=1 Tax=Mesorhizobium sp. M0767 TaxID=2956995 RepID=UPI0033357BD7